VHSVDRLRLGGRVPPVVEQDDHPGACPGSAQQRQPRSAGFERDQEDRNAELPVWKVNPTNSLAPGLETRDRAHAERRNVVQGKVSVTSNPGRCLVSRDQRLEFQKEAEVSICMMEGSAGLDGRAAGDVDVVGTHFKILVFQACPRNMSLQNAVPGEDAT
jgi:hypothetical protein